MTPRQDMERQIGAILDGVMSEAEALAFLNVTDETSYSAEQIAGACDAVMTRAVAFPHYHKAVDCCGTGGDYQHTLNISTAAALVTAACGAMVAKHGNRAITSKSGSADLLEVLGVRTDLTPDACALVLKRVGICFLFAPTFHPGFGRLASLRKQIGHRTIFNLLGPLCNPAHTDHQLIGVYDGRLCEPVAGAAKLLGKRHVMVVHGRDGADEISICAPTQVCELHKGQLRQYEIDPERVGLSLQPAESITGGDAMENADALRRILGGTVNGYARAVALNAGAALYVAGKASGLRGGITMAETALADGSAKHKLEELVEASGKA